MANESYTTKVAGAATAGAGLTTLGLAAAAAWVIALRQMKGMDMGEATDLGSFGSFIGYWMPMMAAMMLPSAAPAVFSRVRARAVPRFVGSYLAGWTVLGIAVYAVYRPHGPLAAGAVTVAAGLYELSPLKRYSRARCRTSAGSGFEFGRYCLGSSIGLMAMLMALGAMSIAWMSLIAALVFAQKLMPEHPAIEIPVAFAIVAFGVAVAAGI
jgi:predicted metal-binding membrane protein